MLAQENLSTNSNSSKAVGSATKPETTSVEVGTLTTGTGRHSNEAPLMAKVSPDKNGALLVETANNEPMRGALTVQNKDMSIKLAPNSFIRINAENEGIGGLFSRNPVQHPQLQFILPSESKNYLVEKNRETWTFKEDIYILRDIRNNAIVSGVISRKLQDGEPKIMGITPDGKEVELKYSKEQRGESSFNNGPHASRYVDQSSFQAVPIAEKHSNNLALPKAAAPK